jgi:RNA recognition motif-containing protein
LLIKDGVPNLSRLTITHILFLSIGDDFAGRPLAPGVDVKTNDSALAQRTHSKTAQKILREQKQPPAPTLFIGNLGFETTDDAIRQLFEAHRVVSKKEVKEGEGEEKTKDVWIRKVRMGTFEDSGLCKGYTRTPQINHLHT